MLPVIYMVAGVVLASSAVLAGDPPTAGQRRLVSYGPYGKPVQETAVAGATVEGAHCLLAMWQVQDPPGTGEIESFASTLRYAIGSFHPTTGALSWTEIDDVPYPDHHVTRDAAVAALQGSQVITEPQGGFVGAGVAIDETEEVESAFIALTPLGETEFGPFETEYEFDCCDGCDLVAIARNTRIGSWHVNGTNPGIVSFLLARSVDPAEECAELD